MIMKRSPLPKYQRPVFTKQLAHGGVDSSLQYKQHILPAPFTERVFNIMNAEATNEALTRIILS